jgi:hypothetical protein
MIERRMHRGLFAAATAAALGFGGAQAFASPAAASADAMRACSSGQCGRDCRRAGYDGGFCDQGGCICIIQVPAGP